jgi:dynein heavy chain
LNYNPKQVSRIRPTTFHYFKCTNSHFIDDYKGDSGGGMSREEFIDTTASDILKRIPDVYDLDKLKKKYGLEVTPTQVVLLQELERFNKLISTIQKSLTTLKKALKGEVGMSNELDELAKALYNGQLPTMWRKLAPATKKTLGNWMDHFFKRNNQYTSWVSLLFTFFLVEASP